jgi:hypothetical protein
MKINKKVFLEDNNVKILIEFIAAKWIEGLDFEVGIKHRGKKAVYKYTSNLKEIFETYSWQYSIKTELEIPDEIAKAGFSLSESEKVLNYSKSKLLVNGKINPNLIDLKNATEITLKWGGVFTKGNKKKVTDISYDLKKDYDEVLKKWKEINEYNAGFSPKDNFEFTSKAGFTKIYSLILSDFVIYDSRVSVALAYLMKQCFGEDIPEILRIYIPASKVADKTKRQVSDLFKSTYQQDSKHFYSNVISSILLNESLRLINDPVLQLRDLEAALFMMGYDIRPNELKPIAG